MTSVYFVVGFGIEMVSRHTLLPTATPHCFTTRVETCGSLTAAEAGIEPASGRVTAVCAYQHEHHRIKYSFRIAGFEPAISHSSGTRRVPGKHDPHSLHSETRKRPVGVEPTRPPWQGDRLPLHHGRFIDCRIVKDRTAPGGNRTLVAALRVRCLSTEPPVL